MAPPPDDFLPALREKLAIRAAWLESSVLPSLREEVRTYRVMLEGMLGVLLKKGLVPEDRYGYEAALGTEAFAVPPDTAVAEAEEAAVLGSRMEAWCRQLGMLADRGMMELSKLDFPLLEQLPSLITFIDWSKLGEGAPGPTTRALARVLVRVRLGPDAISARVLHESAPKLQALAENIRANLAHVESWKRETWKADLRAKVLPILAGMPRSARPGGAPSDELAAARRVFDRVLPGETWRSDLAQQVLDEDRADDSPARRQRLLASLDVPAAGPAPKDAAEERRAALLDAIRRISRVAADVEQAEEVLGRNEQLLRERPRSLLQRLLRFLMPRRETSQPRYYEIAVRTAGPVKAVTERVNFLQFVAELRELRGVLAALADDSGEEASRVRAMADDDLRRLLDWQVQQLRHAYRWMEGFNELFQLKAASQPVGTVQSVKLTLLRIENGLARAENP